LILQKAERVKKGSNAESAVPKTVQKFIAFPLIETGASPEINTKTNDLKLDFILLQLEILLTHDPE